ncbi:Motile sperm domain-containing protein 2 [Sarcoptes scabiei]|uniref:Motile sperm domain containing 2-like protein 2 n=1 Tax=Sarcoptes scabiei TaxID=52283 RepID=A0A132AA01_SARSC|nr:Motile sperm domain-containing protein 2 [Sarcoptes scabiei]KPM07405.1 motile sperm domain containing 2-like protein 2 [Sarcoptes scabiei]
MNDLNLLEKIDRIRNRFEEELQSRAHLYHPIDIERVQKEQWQVERFVRNSPENENDAYEALKRCLRWKKSFGIHERSDASFAKELWELCAVEVNGRDHCGRLIQWEAFRNQRKFKELDLIAKQFVAHNIERLDRMAGENGFILVSDLGGAGISNLDIDMIRFKLATIEYYPYGLRQMLIVDLPWLLNSVMNLILTLMRPAIRDMTIFCKRRELSKYIAEEHIHRSLDGKREEHCFPPNMRPMDQMMDELNLSENFIEHFYKTFKLSRTINQTTVANYG